MPITNEQLAEIQAKVVQLVTDKGDADTKTQDSNKADADLATATTAANLAKLDEAAADAKVSTDLQDLTSFLDALVQPPPPQP